MEGYCRWSGLGYHLPCYRMGGMCAMMRRMSQVCGMFHGRMSGMGTVMGHMGRVFACFSRAFGSGTVYMSHD